MDAHKKVREFLLENEDLFQLVGEINSWDGSLDDMRYYENDEEFFEISFNNGLEIARAITYGDYHYMDEYVKFNAYGNLVSNTEYGIRQEMEENIDEIVDALFDNYQHLWLSDELEELLNELEEQGEI